MQDSAEQDWVLRIFNGSLQGAEFTLKQRRTLFVVGDPKSFCGPSSPLPIPADALYIPHDEGGLNFELVVDNAVGDSVLLRVLNEGEHEERRCAAQVIEQIGPIRIAVRLASEEWAGQVFHAPATADLSHAVHARRPLALSGWSVALATVLALGLLAAFAWMSRSNPVNDVRSLIQGASSGTRVISTEDRQLYIFVDSERDAAWTRQVLVRNPQPAATHVVSRIDESRRLGEWLEQRLPGLAWYRIDLADPAQPRVLVSHQRNRLTASFEQRLHSAMQEVAPYVRSVSIQAVDDQWVAREAEAGLTRLALPFHRIETEGVHLTFNLQGSLEDRQIESAREFVTGFYRQWGDRYVNFAVDLKDDWLKGKSFQYGAEGYVKLAPTSWYFPKPDLR